jgi:hypothetical protein
MRLKMYSLKPWISCYHEVADNITTVADNIITVADNITTVADNITTVADITTVAAIHFSNTVCNILSCKTEPPEVMSSFEVSRPTCYIPYYTHYIAYLIPLFWFIIVRCIAPD